MQRLARHGARLRELRRRVRHRPPGEVAVDGRRLVADLVRWGVPIRELYVASGSPPDPAVLAAAEAAWEVDPAMLADIAPTRHPQGVLAVVAEPAPAAWDGRNGVALYLDGVQDPGNLGAIVRCAAALGGTAVLLGVGCADPFHPTAVRGSAGAVFRLPVEREVDLAGRVAGVRSAGGEVWAAAASGRPLAGWLPRPPVLLLLGAEGAGVSAAAVDLAHGTVTIPLELGVESLNVAVAAGILLQHLRDRGGQRAG